jgi:hypothetical protein
MRKIAIIAEGQSELIFVRNLLFQTMDCSKICFDCFRLYADRTERIPFKFPNPNAEVSFLIINVSQDEKVLSFIKEREESLLSKGYERIIGLRDMYSEEYIKRSPDEINDRVIKALIDGWNTTIQNMNEPSKIKLCVAIMEIEAWFLAMYNIFGRINSILSIEYIESKLGINLTNIDPQSFFLKPANIVDSIFQLAGSQYNKKEHDVEKICNLINNNDIANALEKGKCSMFKEFYEEIVNTIIV